MKAMGRHKVDKNVAKWTKICLSMVYSPWCFYSCLQHRDLIQKYWVEGFYEVNFTESVWALQLMCEVAEVGEGEAVKDSLTVDVTEISPRPQASRGLRLQVEGTL